MLTKRDRAQLLEDFSKVFATKTELHELRDELKNDILNFKVEILGEIRSMRDEIAILVGYRQTIENHDKRLTRVEDVLAISA